MAREIIVPQRTLQLVQGLQEVHFGSPTSKDLENPQSFIAKKYPGVEEVLQGVEANNGIKLAVVDASDVEKVLNDDNLYQKIKLMRGEIDPGETPLVGVIVEMQPGSKVVEHIHQDGDEVRTLLTPTIEYRGEVNISNGTLIFDSQDRVASRMRSPILLMGGNPAPIGELDVHGYENPMANYNAVVLFLLPKGHITGDKKLAIPTETNISQMATLIEAGRGR